MHAPVGRAERRADPVAALQAQRRQSKATAVGPFESGTLSGTFGLIRGTAMCENPQARETRAANRSLPGQQIPGLVPAQVRSRPDTGLAPGPGRFFNRFTDDSPQGTNVMDTRKLLAAAGFAAVMGVCSTALADDMVNNYVSTGSGSVVKDSAGNCWRTRFEDTSERLEECGYEKPMAVVTREVEVVAAPTAATMTTKTLQEITISAAMLFGFDSAELSDDAEAVIDERIQALRGEVELTSVMKVVGHTDSTGPEAYNQALSQRRAQAVADYIVSRAYNVRPADIEVVGMGEADPIASNDTREGRAENRRVVVFAEARATR